MREPSDEKARLLFALPSRVICTGSPCGSILTKSSPLDAKLESARTKASIRPSGDTAGFTTASGKFVRGNHWRFPGPAFPLSRWYQIPTIAIAATAVASAEVSIKRLALHFPGVEIFLRSVAIARPLAVSEIASKAKERSRADSNR